MQKRKYIHIIMIWILVATSASAQLSHIRNQIFIGVRPMGMGETFVGVADDGNSIYWNPAGLPSVGRYELLAMHTNIFNARIANNYLSFLIPNLPYLAYSEKLAFGLDWFNINSNDAALEFSQNRFTLSTGYRPAPFFALGLNVKYLNLNAIEEGRTAAKATGWGYDLGVLIHPWRGLSLGCMAHDVTDTRLRYGNGTSSLFYFRNIRYGLAYKFSDFFLVKHPLFAIDIDDRLHVGSELWLHNILALRAGLQKDLYSQGEKDLTFSFGAGIRYKYFQIDYALTNSPMLENTHRFSVCLNFELPPSPVTFQDVEIKDIYLPLYRYYQTHPAVISTLNYEGDKRLECMISVKEKRFGISGMMRAEVNPQLETSNKIGMSVTLPERLLELSPLEKYTTTAEIILEPKTFIRSKSEKFILTEVNIYGMNTIDWSNGTDQAAAFICPHQKLIREFADTVNQYFQDVPDATVINQNISQAIQLYNALRQCGIRYQRDLNTPYSQASHSLDTILYPFQLLNRKQGDCDDLTVLYASLLECAGIQTAFVTIPGHIFLMFNTELHERESRVLCTDTQMYVVKDQRVWLPVETTFYGLNHSFRDAWEKGAEQYFNSQDDPGFEVVDIHEAWETYEPFCLEADDLKIAMPDQNQIFSIFNPDRQQILDSQNHFLEENYLKPLMANPGDLKRKNELALIYFARGEIKKAEKIFDQIVRASGF